ncbi:MAG: acyl transferase [Reichenbachiella sp.]|uniref:LuxE/PaaK family acyltransferase n=1 Tax=Reichenbachiella sp. TaxID=2184521 RepID=UPI00326758AD
MKLLNSFKKKCFEVNSATFDALALELFQHQAKSCQLYRKYINHLGIDVKEVTDISQIPCLPIDFFKHHEVQTGSWERWEYFLSSGTTSNSRSKHLIEDSIFYLNNSKLIFERLFRPLNENVFFALLPSYQEQGNSSLVKMVDFFIKESGSVEAGGFYLNRQEELIHAIKKQLEVSNKSVILFSVGYALLDLCQHVEDLEIKLDGLTIIETGGMKGRRKDMIKKEFYSILKNKLGEVIIHSEYGMTELLSQAYSFNERTYKLPSQMKVLIRDPEDPFNYFSHNRVGGINVIDLANVHSCAFIETRDLGAIPAVGEFEILGRLDNSDIRGCNLMII